MRYTVQEQRGMCLGAGMFQVVDGLTGQGGAFHYSRDEAQRAANRLNLQDREESAESRAIAASFAD